MREGTRENWARIFVLVLVVVAAVMCVLLALGQLGGRWAAETPEVSAPKRVPGVDFESLWVKTDYVVDEVTGVRIARTIAGRDTDGSSPSVHTLVTGRVIPDKPVRKSVPKKVEPKPVTKPKRR